jgi:uncharacterized protein (TIGR00299 family) protein
MKKGNRMSEDRRILVIDCQVAGVSGDMIVGALLDLGVDVAKVVKAMESVKDFIEGCEDIEVTVRDVTRKEFHAKKVDVKAKETNEMSGLELIKATARCLEYLELSKGAKQFTLNSINTLVETEARIHGKPIHEIHLHEAGSVDTPADIIGTAVAADDLGIFNMKVYSTPVAVGGGLFKFSHGAVSSPAPATIEILRSRDFPMIGGPIEFELATPTGVSLLVNIAHEVVRFYPLMKPTAIGYGAGKKDFAEMPNVLRITLGESIDHRLLRDEISVLETNLDDVAGEIIGHTIDKLLQEGARDVCVIPMFTKKNRPGQILKLIADKDAVERLSRVLIEETGTLGVRVYPCERRILDRESIPVDILVDDVKELVNVKVAKDGKGEIVHIKPEYDDVKRVSDKTSKPLREITELVKMKAREVLLKR